MLWRLPQTVNSSPRCRHYHALTRPFEVRNSLVALYHMACVVDEATRNVTFLYKFEPGASSKSHGVNVARLAGLPEGILSQVCGQSAADAGMLAYQRSIPHFLSSLSPFSL